MSENFWGNILFVPIPHLIGGDRRGISAHAMSLDLSLALPGIQGVKEVSWQKILGPKKNKIMFGNAEVGLMTHL